MKDTTRSDGGEIVQVQGSHIIRSTGRKDRHSKVYTSKGPRDRRVRLSAHTAIQFYDVQDRLGYDRPSKAVDWLINKAKTAIDKLNNEVPPPWQMPSTQYDSSINSNPSLVLDRHHHQPTETLSGYALIQPNNNDNSNNINNPTSTLSCSFPGFPNDAVLTRSDHHHLHQFHGQDLGLSLHPFQENFQRMDNGYFMNNNNSMFWTQGELLQSNLDHNTPLDDQQNNRGRPSWDFGNPFELGFHRVPAGIYRQEEEEEDHDDDLQEA